MGKVTFCSATLVENGEAARAAGNLLRLLVEFVHLVARCEMVRKVRGLGFRNGEKGGAMVRNAGRAEHAGATHIHKCTVASTRPFSLDGPHGEQR